MPDDVGDGLLERITDETRALDKYTSRPERLNQVDVIRRMIRGWQVDEKTDQPIRAEIIFAALLLSLSRVWHVSHP